MNVTVLGAGSWGTTVASIASKRNPTTLWARSEEVVDVIVQRHENSRYLAGFPLPERLEATSDLERAASTADVLVVGVPSDGFRDVLERAREFVRPWIPVVSLTKGFERDTYLRMTEVIKDVLPGRPSAALTGPNIAREIMAGYAAASVLATEDLAVAAALQGVLRRGLFRIYTNHDVVGCEVGGALKNDRHRGRDGPGPGGRRQHPLDGHHAGPGRADPPGGGDGRRSPHVLGPGRDGRPDGDVHQPPQPEPPRRGAAGEGTPARGDPQRDDHGGRGREDRLAGHGARRAARRRGAPDLLAHPGRRHRPADRAGRLRGPHAHGAGPRGRAGVAVRRRSSDSRHAPVEPHLLVRGRSGTAASCRSPRARGCGSATRRSPRTAAARSPDRR